MSQISAQYTDHASSQTGRLSSLRRDGRDGESTSWPLSSDTRTRFAAGSSARGVRNNASSTYSPRSTLSYVLRGTWSVTPLRDPTLTALGLHTKSLYGRLLELFTLGLGVGTRELWIVTPLGIGGDSPSTTVDAATGVGRLALVGTRVELLLHTPVPVGNDSSTCTRGSAVLAGAAGRDGRRVDSA